MDIYRLLKTIASRHVPASVKLAGLAVMIAARRRVAGVFIDPSMGCNLRCRMCYFSDPQKRASMHGTISDEWLSLVERSLFPAALKLQIGCGAEPTLYPHLENLISRGRKAGIPYISLTTNGQLLATGKVNLEELVDAGLNELTLSLHGTSRDNYEYLMPGVKYDNLLRLIDMLASIKQHHPNFKIRINFTVNSRNLADLRGDGFWNIWQRVQPDIVQLRPVQQMGQTDWDDFNAEPIKAAYPLTIGNVIEQCRLRNITCIAPSLEQIDSVVTEQDGTSALIEDVTYCYVSPSVCYKPDFDPSRHTFFSYARRRNTVTTLIKAALAGKKGRERNASKKLNYRID